MSYMRAIMWRIYELHEKVLLCGACISDMRAIMWRMHELHECYYVTYA